MIFAKDVSSPEGPVHLPDGRWAITEMGRGVISLVSADGQQKQQLVHTGRPNGLALDANGNLWVAESKYPSLLRISPDGQTSQVAHGTDATPFLWPNDLCFGPDGAAYMTDSGVLLADFEGISPPEAAYEVPVDGKLWRIDPVTGQHDLLDQGLQFANGIAFGPSGNDLYVSETLTGNIYRYHLEDGHVVGKRALFGNVMIKPSREHGQVAGPDGMAFDQEGKLYVTVLTEGNITILDRDGSVNSRVDLPGSFPTNIAFDTTGQCRALVTEGSGDQLLLIDTPAPGLPLYPS